MTYQKPVFSETKDPYDDSVVISTKEYVLHDGRPVIRQIWAESGYDFATYFFTQEGIEHLQANDVLPYLESQGADIVKPRNGRSPNIDLIQDDEQKNCWRITLIIWDPDYPYEQSDADS